MKKGESTIAQVLILMSSPRKNGNTDRLANAFIKGVEENGYTTEKVCVNYQNIKPCLGCNVCQKTKQCGQKDDRSKHNYLCFTCVFLHI